MVEGGMEGEIGESPGGQEWVGVGFVRGYPSGH